MVVCGICRVGFCLSSMLCVWSMISWGRCGVVFVVCLMRSSSSVACCVLI